MVYNLQGRVVLITGGSRGLGAITTERFAAEGCSVVINCVSSVERAEALAEKVRREFKVAAMVVKADVGKESECRRLVEECVRVFGALDIIVSNAGWTKMGTEFSDLDAYSEEDWDKCWAVNVKANMHLLRAALPSFNSNPDGGVLLITSSTAATNPNGSSIAYSVSKAAGLHLMRCLAETQGPKVRVNAIQPGLLLTEWGNQFSPEKIGAVKEKCKLKRVPTIEECADAFVLMAKSENMTGSTLKIDGGLFV